MAAKYLFIAGVMGRSGTTLLELVLSSSKMVSIAPENHTMESLFKMTSSDYGDAPDRGGILELLKGDQKMAQWPRFNFEELSVYSSGAVSAKDWIDSILNYYAIIWNKKPNILGHKKGFYARGYADIVKKSFPQAKFIYTYRDPRDIVESYLKNIKDATIEFVVSEILARHQFIERTKLNYPKDVLTLKYEEFVEKPRAVLEQICRFIYIPFDKEMLDFYKFNSGGDRLISSTAAIHENTKKNFDTSQLYKWRTGGKLSKRDIIFIENLCSEIIDQHGYEQSGRPSIGLKGQFRKRQVIAKSRSIVAQFSKRRV